MQRPNPGDLLRGLREGLAASVLPELPKGAGARQLRAALHLIARLERSWDLWAAHLDADNRDIEETLRALADPALAAALDAPPPPAPSGFNGAEMAGAAARNLHLHTLLDDLAARCPSPALDALLRRMAERDAILMGDDRA